MYDDDDYDGDEYEALQSLKKKVAKGNTKIAEGLDQLTAATREGDAKLLSAFNRMADAMQDLAREVRGLREDLTPTLDKAKLPSPGQKGM